MHSILHLCWCWKSWGWLDWQRGCCSPWVAETGLSAQDPAPGPDPGLVWRDHRTQKRTDLRGLIHQGMLQREVEEDKRVIEDLRQMKFYEFYYYSRGTGITLAWCSWWLSLHIQPDGKVVLTGLDEHCLLYCFTSHRASQSGQELVQSVQIGIGKLLLM